MSKMVYKCKVDGSLGRSIVKGKVCGGICGYVKMDSTCGADRNFKCEHKAKEQGE